MHVIIKKFLLTFLFVFNFLYGAESSIIIGIEASSQSNGYTYRGLTLLNENSTSFLGHFFIKYKNEDLIWFKKEKSIISKITLDKNNSSYIALSFSNQIKKYNQNGDELWIKELEGDDFVDMILDEDANIYILSLDDNSERALLSKYLNNGTKLWTRDILKPILYNNNPICFDKNENLIIATQDSIFKYNKDGDLVKKVNINIDGYVYFTNIDEDNNTFISGETSNKNFFIAKYDTEFNKLWKKEIIDSKSSFGQTIFFKENNVYVIAGTLSKEFSSLKNLDGASFILIKYDNQGERVFTKELLNDVYTNTFILTSDKKAFFVKDIFSNIDKPQIVLTEIDLENTKATNQPPTLTTKSITPNKIKSGENIIFTTTWDDPENKSIVDVKVRYTKQGSLDWTTNVMSHKSGYTFEKEKAIIGSAGNYHVEFMAKDADTPSGERTNDTGWLDGGNFEIEADTVVIPPIVTPTELPTLSLKEDINFGKSTSRSLNITNTAKIRLEVKNGTEVQVNFDGIGSYEDSKTITTDGIYEFSYLFKKSDYTSDSSNFWKKDLTFTATAYNGNGASNVVASGKFTIYDLNEWRAWQDKLEKERIQADIDSKTSDKEKALDVYRSGKDLYSQACVDAYQNLTFSNEKKPNDPRRILNGVKIYSDIGNEKTIEGKGTLPDTSTFKVYVQYGSTTNYPARVEIRYDINGYPLDDGSTRRKQRIVQNYADKELMKGFLLQSIIVGYFDGVCTERNALEVMEKDVDVIQVIKTDNFDIEEDIKKEVAFDTYAGLNFDDSLMLLVAEDESFKEFLYETDYYTEYERDVLVAYYHYERWFEQPIDYIIPDKYWEILKDESVSGVGSSIFDWFIPYETANAGKLDVPKKVFNKVEKFFNKKLLKVVIGNTKSSIIRGINTHKKWEKDKLYDIKYPNGGKHEHEFVLPRPGVLTKSKKYEAKYRVDAMQVDEIRKIIRLRELKPDNIKSFRLAQKQLERYKNQFEELIKMNHVKVTKYKGYTIQIGSIDVYK